jgi:hypothetical protein
MHTLSRCHFCCNVFYGHADGLARARGKVLPWDKKLTLANSKFTACIFIFLTPAPSASNRGSAPPFSPFISPIRCFLFYFVFYSQALQTLLGVGVLISIQEWPGCDCHPLPQVGGHPVPSTPSQGDGCETQTHTHRSCEPSEEDRP